jgi:hypothetical protein
MSKIPAPEHMDRWTRNERLYRHLRDMGLFVVPVYSDGEQPGIEYMHVATSMPDVALLSTNSERRQIKKRGRVIALSSIVAPEKGLKVP